MHFTEKKSMIYDLLKAFAILAVVAGHCLAMFTPDGAIPTVCGSRLLGFLGSIVYRFHIPCLFVVSGALFAFCWRKGHYHDPRLFLRKKALRLLVPYLFFGVVLVFPTLVICGLWTPKGAFSYLLHLLVGDQSRHLWYVYCLFVAYCFFWPFMRRFEKGPWKRIFLISLVVAVISKYLPIGFLGYFQLCNFLYYQFYFICGILLEQNFRDVLYLFHQYPKRIITISLGLLVVSLIFGFGSVGSIVYAFAGIALIFMLSLYLSENTELHDSKLLRNFVKDSYGIYLFHAMIVYLIFYAFSRVAFYAYGLAFVAFCVSLFISWGLTEGCRCLGLGVILGESRMKS